MLTSEQDLGCDTGFSVIRTGLLATLHLWLALHAHRYKAADAAYTTIARHANDACKILKSMVQQVSRLSLAGPPQAKAKSPKETRAPARRPVKRVVTAPKQRSGIPRTARTTRAQMAEIPVTPKPRRGTCVSCCSSVCVDAITAIALNDLSLNATLKLSNDVPLVKPSLLAMVFENLPFSVNLIRSYHFSPVIWRWWLTELVEMVAQLSGMLGHIFVKVQLLSLARRLSEQCAGDCSRGMPPPDLIMPTLMPLSEYLMTSIELAYEYSQLGRANRALSIYSHAVQAVDKVSDLELQALLYLRHSESLAAAGQVLQRFVLFSPSFRVSSQLLQCQHVLRGIGARGFALFVRGEGDHDSRESQDPSVHS